MFQVAAFRPWKRTYATRCVAAATRGETFEARVAGAVERDERKPVRLEERERVDALGLFEPGAGGGLLDERDERREALGRPRELGLRGRRLREARVVLQEDALELPRQLEGLERSPEQEERLVGRARPRATSWLRRP